MSSFPNPYFSNSQLPYMSEKNHELSSVQVRRCETLDDLESGWKFLDRELKGLHRDLEFYKPVFDSHSELLIIAEFDNTICGAVFGHINDKIELHIGEIAVSPDFHHKGIGSQILLVIEKNAIKNNLKRMVLGGKKEVAPFYQSNGFTPNLFIQNEISPTLDELLDINPNIPVLEKFVSQGWNQLILHTNGLREDLETLFRAHAPDAVITYVYDKWIN